MKSLDTIAKLHACVTLLPECNLQQQGYGLNLKEFLKEYWLGPPLGQGENAFSVTAMTIYFFVSAEDNC